MSLAMQGQLSRALRDAGQGGIGPCRTHLWASLNPKATGLSALVVWLKSIKLRIRIGWANRDGWELACVNEWGKKKTWWNPFFQWIEEFPWLSIMVSFHLAR